MKINFGKVGVSLDRNVYAGDLFFVEKYTEIFVYLATDFNQKDTIKLINIKDGNLYSKANYFEYPLSSVECCIGGKFISSSECELVINSRLKNTEGIK